MPPEPPSGQTGATLILKLSVPGNLPSWNELLGKSHWERLKIKKRVQAEFLSALNLSENASSIPIICQKSGCSTVSDIAVLFEEMSRTRSNSRPPKGNAGKAKNPIPKYRCSKSCEAIPDQT